MVILRARYDGGCFLLSTLMLLFSLSPARAEGLPNLASLGVPGDLSASVAAVREAAEQNDALAKWEAILDSISQDLDRLYSDEAADARAQGELLASLDSSLAEIEAALSDPANVAMADPLTSFSNRLRRRIDVLSASLALLESARPAGDEQLEAARRDIARSVASLDRYLEGRPHAESWRDYLDLSSIEAALAADGVPPAERVMSAAARFDPEGLSDVHREVLRRRAFANVRESLLDFAKLLTSRDPAASEELHSQVENLIAALEAYEQAGGRDSAPALHDAFQGILVGGNPAAEALAKQVHRYYAGDNVRLMIAEELLQRTIETDRFDSGPVRDFILGADVFGNQITHSHVSVYLEPNRNAATYWVCVTGQANSDTEGYRDPAVIYTHTTSNFVAKRPFHITSQGMSAGNVHISVDSHNETLGADTNFDWIPLFGAFARGMAVQGAQSQREEAEAIAESRVRDRILPEITRQGNRRIAMANENYRTKVRDPLLDQGLFPDPLRTSSTAHHIFAKGRLAREDEFGGHHPNLWIPGGSLALLQIHHSALDNVNERFELAGKTLDRPGFGELLAERLGSLLPQAVAEAAGEPGPQQGSITFADQNPVLVRFEDGAIRVTLRAASFQSNQVEVPGQIITARYRPEVDGDVIRYVREGPVQVRPINEPKTEQEKARALALSIGMQAAFGNLFREVIETLSAVTFRDEQGRPHTLHLVQVKVLDGWISLAFR